MKCCDKECLTPYCPFCGAKQANGTIEDLYRHVCSTAAHKRKSAETAAAPGSVRSGGRQQHEAVARKWESWRDALADIMESNED